MPQYELIYFDVRGRGETARTMLAARDVPFTDTRYPRDEWSKHKADMPFGQMPVLVVDGKKFAQSVAINAYLARELGFYGSSSLDALAIDQVIQLKEDFFTCFTKTLFATPEEKKVELQKKVIEEDIPKHMGFLCKLLQDNGNKGLFVGDSLTLADLVIFEMIASLESSHIFAFVRDACGKLSDKYPEIQKLNEQVLSDPKIRSHVESIKVSMI